MPRLSLRVGDVFTLPVDEEGSGLGQIVGMWGKDAYYFAFFDRLVRSHPAEDEIQAALGSELVLLGLSLDAKLYARHWTVVGNAAVAAGIPIPAYKVQSGLLDPGTGVPETMVQNPSGTRWRRASEFEAVVLPNRQVIAPVRFEKAFRALKGFGPWLGAYEPLRPDPTIAADRFFGQTL